MSRKIEAVIFDWAGTTVDYGSFAPVQAFIEAFRQFGVVPTVEEVREPMGKLKWDHIHSMMEMDRIRQEWERVHGKPWSKADVDEVYQKSEEMILAILPEFTTPKPHVLETVEALRSRGIRIGSTTGYTDEMMEIVVPAAHKAGYRPDACVTPNAVNNLGRPYPFMIFRNLECLKISSICEALKVGDTVADICEGKNAGLISVGIVEGSSIMGLSQQEYQSLTAARQAQECARVRRVYENCGADYVLQNMSELLDLISRIEGE